MPNLSKGLRQTYDLQDLAFEAAMAMRESLTKDGKLIVERDDAMALTALIRAHDTCRDRARIDRGKPLPGSLRPESVTKQRKAAVATVAVLDDAPDPQGMSMSVTPASVAPWGNASR